MNGLVKKHYGSQYGSDGSDDSSEEESGNTNTNVPDVTTLPVTGTDIPANANLPAVGDITNTLSNTIASITNPEVLSGNAFAGNGVGNGNGNGNGNAAGVRLT